MRLLAALLAATAALNAQQADLAPETVLLTSFITRMREHMSRQPNYTCVETVERTSQAPGGGSEVEDTLRVEVAVVGDKEMFAWPGSTEFEDVKPTELVSTGMFGNGNFALYERILFGGGGPELQYQKEEELDGRTAARYNFHVPQALSRYQLDVDGKEGIAGYHGSVYIDPQTLELRRLEIVAEDIPEELGLTASEDRVDYGRVEIGDESFLLPVESFLRMASPSVIHRNRTRFTACRKFTGESELVFLDPDLIEAEEAPIEVHEAALPAGARIELEIKSHIQFEQSYVGQAVEARLSSEVKRDKEVIAPKGATARGRVLALERWRDNYVVRIGWTDLEWRGGHAPLKLVYDGMGISLPGQSVQRTVYGDLQIPRPGRRSLDKLVMFWKVVE